MRAPRNNALTPDRNRRAPSAGKAHLSRRCGDCFRVIAPDGSGHAPACLYQGRAEDFPRCQTGGDDAPE